MHHIPVLLKTSISNIINDKNGIYLDITFGNGGHSQEILNNIHDKGKLISLDLDITAIKNNTIHDHRLKLLNINFIQIIHKNFYNKISGIIGDLGMSTNQLINKYRGFSIKNIHSKLDMRMDTNNLITADKIINNYSKNQLAQILINYGDIKNPYKIIHNILTIRKHKKINTIQDLLNTLQIKNRKYLIKIFQAIRIEVNNELYNISFFLQNCYKILKKNAKIAIISYHSKEDKIVKNIFKNKKYKLQQIHKKVFTPTYQEIKINPKSKSAKLRIAIKKYD
jgi:16S rRNA (cytosine1402-N4)-methyltransferase